MRHVFSFGILILIISSAFFLNSAGIFDIAAKISDNRLNKLFQQEKSKQSSSASWLQSASDFKEEKWALLIDEVGPEQAYAEFKYVYTSADIGDQHFAGHFFGRLLAQKMGSSGIGVCDHHFEVGVGCYHGFFSEIVAERGLSIIADLKRSCLEKFGSRRMLCPHGMGHGILGYLGYTHLHDALRECASLTEKYFVFGCTNGVFMEYNLPMAIRSDGISLEPRKLTQDTDIYSPCDTISEQFQLSCYLQIPKWWDAILSQDYSKIGMLCRNIMHEKYTEACYLGTGIIAMVNDEFDVESAVDKCKKMPKKSDDIICRSGIVQVLDSEAFLSIAAVDKPSPSEACEGLDKTSQLQCLTQSKEFFDAIGD